MGAFLATVILGVIISIIGIINMTGNISTLHWYHRKRVSKEDCKPMGKLVGLGTLIIGIAMIIFGILFLFFEKKRVFLCKLHWSSARKFYYVNSLSCFM